MYLPLNMPSRPIRSDEPIFAVNANVQSLSPQGDPFRCALCCSGKAGFAACVARCIATGDACDGGLHNCTPC
jgi:hypothetical protein